jgi:lincosamide nucleotidyltransferase A/C/D/E
VGQGIIDGETVRCLTAEYQIDSHTGYPQRPSDRQDVHALAGRFGLPLPPKYRTPASP